jgi:hypothetical protein
LAHRRQIASSQLAGEWAKVATDPVGHHTLSVVFNASSVDVKEFIASELAHRKNTVLDFA